MKHHLTWDAVLNIINSSQGITNAQIAQKLEADASDVGHLTRLMLKAEQVRREQSNDSKALAFRYFKVNGGRP